MAKFSAKHLRNAITLQKTSQAESSNTYSDMMKYQFFLDSLYDQPEIQVYFYIYLREKAYTKTVFSCSLFY